MSLLSPAELLALAPGELENRRASRYLGDNISVPLERFSPENQRRIHTLYTTLIELLALLRASMADPEQCLAELRAYARRVGWIEVVRKVQQIMADSDDETLLKVVHDIRGGGFQALSIMVQFVELTIFRAEELHRMFFLTRDHLKIMRNAVLGIDPQGYERDRQESLHNVDLLTEKWQHAIHRLRDKHATVAVECSFVGNVSERCLEFAALDRVLYNLLNNAVRNTADGMVYLSIFPLPQANPQNLRFVIANTVTPEQHELLDERYPNGPGELFRGGFTTGGTGLGMRICAEFVANAFGVNTVHNALAGRYVGAELRGDVFVNWFHWPIAAD